MPGQKGLEKFIQLKKCKKKAAQALEITPRLLDGFFEMNVNPVT